MEDFLFQKIGTDSVIYADSGDIKILVRFHENPTLFFFEIFWKCVGGTDMRGCFPLKIAKWVYLFMLVILVYTIRGIY